MSDNVLEQLRLAMHSSASGNPAEAFVTVTNNGGIDIAQFKLVCRINDLLATDARIKGMDLNLNRPTDGAIEKYGGSVSLPCLTPSALNLEKVLPVQCVDLTLLLSYSLEGQNDKWQQKRQRFVFNRKLNSTEWMPNPELKSPNYCSWKGYPFLLSPAKK